MILPLIASLLLADQTIVQNGKSSWSILIAPGGLRHPSMKHGAKELQRYILQMSGAKLPILTPEAGWSEPTKHLIVIADDAIQAEREHRTALGDEEYRITTRPSGVLIMGGAKRGAMYGCYALLEDVLGVRWYTSRITKVPKRATITLPKLDIKGKPAFEYREPFFAEAFDKDWAVRNRTNGNSQHLDDSVGGKVSYGPFVHTLAEICPPEKYFASHPEYFSEIGGKRMNGYYQLCLTNPDLVDIAVAKVEEWIKANPTATIFSVSQNDTYNNCQCPVCKAVETEEGAPSGPLIRFVNKVAERIEKTHPDVLIDTLAYQWSERPPLHERPRKNVRIRIAPIGACFSHPLDGCSDNADELKNLKDWAKVTNQIYIWHYTTNFANYLQPLPNLDEISGDMKLFKANGVVGVFDEGDYAAGGGGEMAELKSYLLAKLMWDPARDPKAIIDDFLQGVCGKAAPFIKEWLNATHAAGRSASPSTSGRGGQGVRATPIHAKIYDPPTAPYLSEEALAGGVAAFDAAEKAVMNDPVALNEVQRARLSLEYVQLMRTDPKDPAYPQRAKTVADKLKKYGISEVSEGGSTAEFLKKIGQ